MGFINGFSSLRFLFKSAVILRFAFLIAMDEDCAVRTSYREVNMYYEMAEKVMRGIVKRRRGEGK